MKKLYFDTSVISGYVKNDMKSTDTESIEKILIDSKEEVFCSSTMALEEINKIPDGYREPHSSFYESLQIIKGSTFNWIDDSDDISRDQSIDPKYLQLRNILHDENDARHIYLAEKSGAEYFLTVDRRTILSKKSEVEAICSIQLLSPSDYLDRY